MRCFSFLIVCVLWLSSPALAQIEGARTTTFGAKKAESPAPAANDFRAMLAVCDEEREACERDAVGVPFLAAAYMALWVILLAFLFAVRSGSARTRAEMEELRARLRELEGEGG